MERFTQRARRVLSLAQEAAQSMNSAAIDTEHLLLALIREEGGVAGGVLRDLGLDLPRAEALAQRLTKAQGRPASAQLDLSPNVKKALELAVNEARRLSHHAIGSEHLLLGMLRLPDGVALDLLRQLGVSGDAIRRQVAVVLQDDATSNDSPDHPQSFRRQSRRHYDYFLLRVSSRSSGGISQMPVALSDEVKEALEEALAEAGSSGQFILEERHLLLGLLHYRGGVLRRLLREAGIDLAVLTRQLRHPDGA